MGSPSLYLLHFGKLYDILSLQSVISITKKRKVPRKDYKNHMQMAFKPYECHCCLSDVGAF